MSLRLYLLLGFYSSQEFPFEKELQLRKVIAAHDFRTGNVISVLSITKGGNCRDMFINFSLAENVLIYVDQTWNPTVLEAIVKG